MTIFVWHLNFLGLPVKLCQEKTSYGTQANKKRQFDGSLPAGDVSIRRRGRFSLPNALTVLTRVSGLGRPACGHLHKNLPAQKTRCGGQDLLKQICLHRRKSPGCLAAVRSPAHKSCPYKERGKHSLEFSRFCWLFCDRYGQTSCPWHT